MFFELFESFFNKHAEIANAMSMQTGEGQDAAYDGGIY